jgi:SNF2 family DNA or RNA helicase
MTVMDVGVGKTVCALTIIKERMDKFEVTGALVVAPLRVCQAVWEREALKWDYLQDMTFSLCWGAPEKRIAALDIYADVYLVNYENLTWLLQHCKEKRKNSRWNLPFNMVVFDEVTRMANPSGVKCMEWNRTRVSYDWIKYTLGMTATPATNGLMKLFGCYKALDKGKHLGTSVEAFRHEFFYRNEYTKAYSAYGGAKDRIFDRVKSMTYAVENKKIKVPSTERLYSVPLGIRAREQYEELEQDMFTQLDALTELEVLSAAALSNKLLQFCNGTVYLGDVFEKPRRFKEVHDAKLEQLDVLVDEMQGNPVLVSYSFKLDRVRIKDRYPELNVKDVHDYKDAKDLIEDFKNVDILTGHPASMAHGIDGLQDHCHHLIVFGGNWDLELDYQAIGRVRRQGQKEHVFIHRILIENSIDYVVLDSIRNKEATQAEFVSLLRTYSANKKGEL